MNFIGYGIIKGLSLFMAIAFLILGEINNLQWEVWLGFWMIIFYGIFTEWIKTLPEELEGIKK